LAIGKIQVTVEMIKAARELLRWRQEELASRAGIAISTLRRLEGMTGPLQGQPETQARIVSALQGAGIEFIERGVRVR
jgi:transcriptional regulator with XRE-family HTH domain